MTFYSHSGQDQVPSNGESVPITSSYPPTLLTMREGKDGGGKGPLISEDQSLTLATGNGQVLFDAPIVTSGPKMFDASGYHRESLSSTTTPTISSYEQPMLVSPSVRRLTPTECERLMGWPDGHTCLCGCDPYSTAACKCADGNRYAACGNGVVSSVAAWIARRLLAVGTDPCADQIGPDHVR